MTSNLEKDMNYIQMEIPIKEDLLTVIWKELEHIYGATEKYMKGNGYRVKSMDQECGKVLRKIHILENGIKEFQMDMEFILGSMEIGMKVNLNLALNMVMVKKNSQMEIALKVHMLMENLKVRESIYGVTEVLL